MTLLVKPKLLILDEMGYLSLDPFAATCLFQLVSEWYEEGSIILTSNKSYGDWGSIFADNVIASAILDSAAAPLHHDQHEGRKLPVKGQEESRCHRRQSSCKGRSLTSGRFKERGSGLRPPPHPPAIYNLNPPQLEKIQAPGIGDYSGDVDIDASQHFCDEQAGTSARIGWRGSGVARS